jgi:hypothetical protein
MFSEGKSFKKGQRSKALKKIVYETFVRVRFIEKAMLFLKFFGSLMRGVVYINT